MKQYIATIGFVLFSALTYGQGKPEASGQLSPGAAVLFKHVKSRMSVAEKNEIYQKMKLKLGPDRKTLMLEDFPVQIHLYPTDLNKDGAEDVFVSLTCPQLFGDVEGLSLYMKNKGCYQECGGLGGGQPFILPTENKGYPDIIVAGPGQEHPALRWNGTAYDNWKMVRDTDLKKATAIEAYSKAYTSLK